jgi:hypothetical protein
MSTSQRTESLAVYAVLLLYLLTVVLTASPPVLAAVSADGWGTQSSSTNSTLHSVWGSSSSDIYACGELGAILHYDGSSWSSMSSNTTLALYSLWGSSSNDVFAVGESSVIVHYDGVSWSQLSSPVTRHLKGVWGSSGDNVLAVGDGGTIISFNGTGWSTMNSGTTTHLSAIWGSASDNVFAAGNNGVILRYDGMAWMEADQDHPNIAGIWGSAPDDVFAVGNGGAILHYDGSSDNVWAEMDTGALAEDLYEVWGTSHADVFAVGNGGAILHYDGNSDNAWAEMASGTADDLRGVWGSGPLDVFAVGQSGTILHYEELSPYVDSVNPGQGNQGETLTVTISGGRFEGTTSIDFGDGIAVDDYAFGSSLITANITIANDAVTGLRDVRVTTGNGTGVLPGGFSIPDAAIAGVSPEYGMQGQTMDVVVSGTNLGGATAVTFGNGINTVGFTVDSPTQITASISIAASAVIGTRDISVITPGSTASLEGMFSIPSAAITGISPDSGDQGQTLSVVITGGNLYGVTAVSFGDGINVNDGPTVDSPNQNPSQISVEISIAADATTGPRNVILTSADGAASLDDAFTVVAASLIADVGPSSGRQGITLDVVLTGSHLEGATAVSFGVGMDALGIRVNSITVDSPTSITVNITIDANASLGPRDVVVTTSVGTAILANGFTVERATPSVTSVQPRSGRQGETLTIIVRGTNLVGTQAVTFGSGITVDKFTLISFTMMSVDISIAADAEPGPRDLSVSNETTTFTLADGFTVQPAAAGQFPLWIFLALLPLIAGLLILLLFMLRKKRKRSEEQAPV